MRCINKIRSAETLTAERVKEGESTTASGPGRISDPKNGIGVMFTFAEESTLLHEIDPRNVID